MFVSRLRPSEHAAETPGQSADETAVDAATGTGTGVVAQIGTLVVWHWEWPKKSAAKAGLQSVRNRNPVAKMMQNET